MSEISEAAVTAAIKAWVDEGAGILYPRRAMRAAITAALEFEKRSETLRKLLKANERGRRLASVAREEVERRTKILSWNAGRAKKEGE